MLKLILPISSFLWASAVETSSSYSCWEMKPLLSASRALHGEE